LPATKFIIPRRYGEPMADGDRRIRRFYLFRAVTSFALWMPFWTLWAYENLDDLFLIAIVDAAFWATMIGIQIPAGLIGDRYGRKAVLLIGEALFAIGVLTFGLSTEFWQYVISNIIWALGVCFVVSGDTPFVYDTLIELNREKDFTVVMLTATVVMYLTNAAACVVGGLVVEWSGRLDLPLIIAALIALVGSLTVFLLKEPKVKRKREFSYKIHFGAGLRQVLTSRAIIILILFQIIIEIGLYVMAFFRSIYMNEDLELGYLWIGVFFASFLTVAAIVIRVARRIESTLGEKKSLVFMYAAIFASFLVVFLVRHPAAIITQYPIYLVAGIQAPIINGYINRRVDSEHRSTVMAIAVFTFTIILVGFEVAFGYMASAWGLIESLMTLAIVTAPLAAVLLLLWSKEVDKERESKASIRTS
jgi:MFS family permease